MLLAEAAGRRRSFLLGIDISYWRAIIGNMFKKVFKNIPDLEEEKPQTPDKYRIYRYKKVENGMIMYNFSKLFKGEHFTNYPILLKSDLEAKKICVNLLEMASVSVGVKDIEIMPLFQNR